MITAIVFGCVAFTALVISITALVFGMRAYIKVEAMEKSTHSVQYVPLQTSSPLDEEGFEIITDETKSRLGDDELN